MKPFMKFLSVNSFTWYFLFFIPWWFERNKFECFRNQLRYFWKRIIYLRLFDLYLALFWYWNRLFFWNLYIFVDIFLSNELDWLLWSFLYLTILFFGKHAWYFISFLPGWKDSFLLLWSRIRSYNLSFHKLLNRIFWLYLKLIFWFASFHFLGFYNSFRLLFCRHFFRILFCNFEYSLILLMITEINMILLLIFIH